MMLAWRNLGRTNPDGSSAKPGLDITLEFPSQIKAAAGLVTDISQPLLRFFEELATLEGDWSEERRLRDPHRQFSITCFWCYKGEVGFDVSLAAEFQDPAWTVELNLWVKQADLPQTVEHLRCFLDAAKQ
jgi:hypothetical protein